MLTGYSGIRNIWVVATCYVKQEKKMEDVIIKGQDNSSVFVDAWDDGAVWLSIQIKNGSASTVLSREQAQLLVAELNKVLA